MEAILVGAVAVCGFMLSKNNNPRFVDKKFTAKVLENEKPSGVNIYENTRTQKVWNDQQQRANEVFAESRDSLNTNRMISGPPMPIFNKIDDSGKQLPIEFKDAAELKEEANNIKRELASNNMFQKLIQKQII